MFTCMADGTCSFAAHIAFEYPRPERGHTNPQRSFRALLPVSKGKVVLTSRYLRACPLPGLLAT